MKEAFLQALVERPPVEVVQEYVLDRTPHIFTSQVDYVKWKLTLASRLEVDSRAIGLVGSASLGFSLNPKKGYSDYSPGSDIDVAIVSARHFDMAWHAIRALGSDYYKLNGAQKASVADHQQRLIYWGAFDTRSLLGALPFGRRWMEAFEFMTSVDPTRDRHVSGRIYRDFESLSAYHENNIRKLREASLTKDANA